MIMINIISAKIWIILVVTFGTLSLFSQKGFDKGDKYFDQNLFNDAIKCYQSDLKSKNTKVKEHAMQKLADCYRITGEFEKAEETYRKILKRKKKDPVNYLNYGLSLKSSAKYAEAIIQFQEYVRLKPEDPIGKVFLLSCDSAQRWLEETIGKEVKNIEEINTEQSEFSPVLYHSSEKLLFTSSRQGSKKALVSFEGGSDVHRMDLYTIDLNFIESKEHAKSTINVEAINSPMHEGSACFSNDGKEMYFTKTVRGKRTTDNNILITLQVYYSHIDSLGEWTKPINAFSFNSSKYSIGHPSLSKDGQTIYFMSDKPGGFGKTDIYYSLKQTNGEWGNPINLGNSINTFGHELFPYISDINELYFSSNSHPGMGQLDIFKAVKENEKWNSVKNLKPPINSIGNDFGIVYDGIYQRGFFSSDRFNGKGAEDIYSFSDEVFMEMTSKNDTLLFDDASVFDDVKFKLIEDSTGAEIAIKPINRHYTIKIEKQGSYTLKATKNGMPFNTIKFECNRYNLANSIHITGLEKLVYFNGQVVDFSVNSTGSK
jgi:tetratricopeptide (TPR) repeat protein